MKNDHDLTNKSMVAESDNIEEIVKENYRLLKRILIGICIIICIIIILIIKGCGG